MIESAEKETKKRKGGPKPVDKIDKQSATRVVYMTAATLEKIQEKAKRAGESFSGYVQKRALEAAE